MIFAATGDGDDEHRAQRNGQHPGHTLPRVKEVELSFAAAPRGLTVNATVGIVAAQNDGCAGDNRARHEPVIIRRKRRDFHTCFPVAALLRAVAGTPGRDLREFGPVVFCLRR